VTRALVLRISDSACSVEEVNIRFACMRMVFKRRGRRVFAMP